MDKTKVAVIGAGYWGKNLVRVFHSLGVLEYVCDTDCKRREDFACRYPGVKTGGSFDEILKDSSLSALVIATPAGEHYKMAKAALLAGKDVFVEKPLSLDVREAAELVELAKEKKRILMVGHILNYHPAVKKLKEFVSSGYLGKTRYIYSNRLNIGKLRTEENILWSFAPHDISVIMSLTGEKPVSVFAFGGEYLTPGVHDTTLTAVTFSSGVKAHIFVSWLNPFKEQKLVVVGSEKMAVFDDTEPVEKLVIYPHTIEWQAGKIPVARKAQKTVVELEKTEPLTAECGHFIECIEKRQKPLTDGEEGLRVLEVLDSAQKSLSGKSPALPCNYFADKTSIIDENVSIGKGTKIWAFSHILKNTTIGEHSNLGQNVVAGPNVVIGSRVKIQNNVSVYEGVTLEDEVFCGPSMVFTNIFNPRAGIPRMKELRKTVVKKGASIGANATIVCGHSIGRYAFVGAGSVVTKDVPDFGLVKGVPAKLSGWICKCGVKLLFKKDRTKCSACGAEYKKTGKEKVEEM